MAVVDVGYVRRNKQTLGAESLHFFGGALAPVTISSGDHDSGRAFSCESLGDGEA
jgi:hypothetical protein